MEMFVLLSTMRLQLPTLDPMRLCNCEVVPFEREPEYWMI